MNNEIELLGKYEHRLLSRVRLGAEISLVHLLRE